MIKEKSEIILDSIFYYLEQQMELRAKKEELIELLEKRLKQEEETNSIREETINILKRTIDTQNRTIEYLKKDRDSSIIKFLKKIF